MNKNETMALMNMLNAAYPRSTANMTTEERTAQLRIWHIMFEGDAADTVFRAAKMHIATSKFMPSISEIKAGVREITMTPVDDLYKQLIRAGKLSIKSKLEGFKEVSLKFEMYESLPDELKAYVGSPNGLQEFNRERQESETKARDRFAKSIDKIREQMDVQHLLLEVE